MQWLLVSSLVVCWLSEVSLLSINECLIGGFSVVFKNAMIGVLILVLIEGVSTIVGAFQMRWQHQMIQEMMEAEKKKMQDMQYRKERNLDNPWAVDYNETLSKENTKASEGLKDIAKSYSF